MALSDAEMRKAQARLLEMGKAIARVLEDGGVPYVIAYGTLLGAVRHGGFIPWDDDFDLFVLDDAYEEGVELLREKLPPGMFVEDAKSEPLYFHAWAHVKDLGTIAVSEAYPHDNAYAHKGLSVDLYRARVIAEDQAEGYIAKEAIEYLERRRSLGLIGQGDYDERMKSIGSGGGGPREAEAGSGRLYVFDGCYACRTCAAGDLLPARRYAFEDGEFWGPADADAILAAVYGDYMTPPPTGQRRGHYSSIKFLSDRPSPEGAGRMPDPPLGRGGGRPCLTRPRPRKHGNLRSTPRPPIGGSRPHAAAHASPRGPEIPHSRPEFSA